MTMIDHDHSRLQTLAGAAGLNKSIRHRLLNGQRRQVAVEFGLSDQEIQIVMAIDAKTLGDFVRGLLDWTTQQQPGAA